MIFPISLFISFQIALCFLATLAMAYSQYVYGGYGGYPAYGGYSGKELD